MQYKILQLAIDGINQLDEFEKELEGTSYLEEYRVLLTVLEHYVETGEMVLNKIKELKGVKNGDRKEFEFRTTNIRLYAVQGDTGKIIILCGFKKNWKKDIGSFRTLKKQIFNK